MAKQNKLTWWIGCLSVLVLSIQACQPGRLSRSSNSALDGDTPTVQPATQTVAPPTFTVRPSPTSPYRIMPPSPQPQASELHATLSASLSPTSTPRPGNTPIYTGIGDVRIVPLKSPAGYPPLWAAFSLGSRRYEPLQNHFVTLYTHDTAGWREAGRVELPNADLLDDSALQQVAVENSQVWLQVDSASGAHSGCFDLLRFDGRALQPALSNCASTPPAGWLHDLNGDGAPEVLLDRSDDYVFSYTLGLRLRDEQIWRWNGVELVEVRLSRLPGASAATAPPELVEGASANSATAAPPEPVEGASTSSAAAAPPEPVEGASTGSASTDSATAGSATAAPPELVEGASASSASTGSATAGSATAAPPEPAEGASKNSVTASSASTSSAAAAPPELVEGEPVEGASAGSASAGSASTSSATASSADAVALNNRAVDLAQADLWVDAQQFIQQALSRSPQEETIRWNALLIDHIAAIRAEAVTRSPYPLLSYVFYGDYPEAMRLVRGRSPKELFSNQSTLISGTLAQGRQVRLHEWMERFTSQALEVQPDLAAAYFLRAWSTYLVDPQDRHILDDLAAAARLDPKEALFGLSLEYMRQYLP